ncbi:sulfurtransferase FdhD [Veronia nyctiphanis]|uniref:Sulfur carrier protein FdhD n=1 Tax=Veronia nyctiphanis TaxID=1278244 RepID=A0A4Q0YMV4_9GAMM|nr:formate dehydrogenase accessory sulfurtransferase FdhD [Veronia nyctiphanis]RXJ71773.1 sulfurtransferase FdhD [Veronia nyctiphanis]
MGRTTQEKKLNTVSNTEQDAIDPDNPLPAHSNVSYSTEQQHINPQVIVPCEVPLAISYNGVNHAVMMVTPQDVDDFVVGFSLTSHIIKDSNEVHDIQLTRSNDALLADLSLANRAQARLSESKRQLAGSTGCGICGIESLQKAFPDLQPLKPAEPLSEAQLCHARCTLRDWQKLGNVSGAIHGALILDSKGDIKLSREDIGRHNALDKVIGAAMKANLLSSDATLLVTSRCSIELVQKAITAGVSSLVTLGTPTTLAIKTAQQYGLNLIHLPRRDTPRFYDKNA